MTRINCIPVAELTRQHLVAEYRELPRVFGAVHKLVQAGKTKAHDPTEAYTLGKGHVLFFYTRLNYLFNRANHLYHEMVNRGYHPQHHPDNLAHWAQLIPEQYWNSWLPTSQDMLINRNRILDRLLKL